MSVIEFTSTAHSALAYYVLSHLDLGRDAASLFDATKPNADWQSDLRAAFLNADGRLWLHFLPIQATDWDDLCARLESPPNALADTPGRILCDAFSNALKAERPAFQRGWIEAGATRRERINEVTERLEMPLGQLRLGLWALTEQRPPPLTVLHCRDLGKCGRGVTVRSKRVVGVSLDEPLDHVLCQIFHEETHPVSDPSVSPGRGAPRSTRAAHPGYGHHMALEKAAVQLGRQIVKVSAPDWVEAYERWAGRYGM